MINLTVRDTVKVHYTTELLEDLNSIFGRMRDNKIDGRVVMKI